MKREDYERELEKEKGKEYLEQHKGLLDDQWEYIESLGDPEGNIYLDPCDIIFSAPVSWKIDAPGIPEGSNLNDVDSKPDSWKIDAPGIPERINLYDVDSDPIGWKMKISCHDKTIIIDVSGMLDGINLYDVDYSDCDNDSADLILEIYRIKQRNKKDPAGP